MALTEFSFILLLAATVLVFFVVPKKYQWIVLLIASCAFYLSFGVAQAGYVLLTTAASYLGARHLGVLNVRLKQPGADKPAIKSAKKRLVILLAAVNLALLIALKYAGMVFPSAGGWVVPLGISYYTLSAIGYVIDVYRAKYEPEKNPLRLLLFEIFFLHIVQGPFARFDLIGRELSRPHALNYDNLKLGAVRMLWGYLKKMVVADWLGVYVNAAFDFPGAQTGLTMSIAILMFTLQMYCDFSGYMDIVCGAGQAMGIAVPENFDRPLGAGSVAEFWRKWHITLGSWFKDYVFYPVSVSRPAVKLGKALRRAGKLRLAKLMPALLALCVVWPLTGLWHGANWTFVLWGCLNGAAILSSMLMEPLFDRWRAALHIRADSRWWRAVSVLRTFLLLALIRVFTPAETVPQAIGIYQALFRWGGIDWTAITSYAPDIRKLHIAYAAMAAALSLLVLFVESRGSARELLERFNARPLLVKYAVGIALLYIVVLLSATGDAISGGFLYANF